MKYTYDDQKQILTICPEGQMDSGNASVVRQKLTAVREEFPQGQVVFDLDRLDYISSAGLRILLRFIKAEKNRVRAVNASPEVMDIFRMTGFDFLIDITQKIRQVSVRDCTVIGRGANGIVYRLDPDTIIKVFHPDADLAMVEREQKKARSALMSGLPTAISYDVVCAGDSYGIVFEMINSKSLAEVMREDPEQFDRYAQEYALLLKEIHHTEGDADIFGFTKAIYEEAVDYCRDYYTQEELGKLRSLIRSVPDRATLIHGDYHPKNIMLIDGELTLIDMGDLSLGHPIYDFLATAAAQINLVKLDPVFAEQFTGMPAQMVIRLWNALLEKYFDEKSREEIGRIDRRIADFSKLKVALAPYFARDIDEDVVRASVQDAKTNLLPAIDSMINALSHSTGFQPKGMI